MTSFVWTVGLRNTSANRSGVQRGSASLGSLSPSSASPAESHTARPPTDPVPAVPMESQPTPATNGSKRIKCAYDHSTVQVNTNEFGWIAESDEWRSDQTPRPATEHSTPANRHLGVNTPAATQLDRCHLSAKTDVFRGAWQQSWHVLTGKWIYAHFPVRGVNRKFISGSRSRQMLAVGRPVGRLIVIALFNRDPQLESDSPLKPDAGP